MKTLTGTAVSLEARDDGWGWQSGYSRGHGYWSGVGLAQGVLTDDGGDGGGAGPQVEAKPQP